MTVFLGGEHARAAQTVRALLADSSPTRAEDLRDALTQLAHSMAGREPREEEHCAVLLGDDAFEALLRRYLHEGLRQFGKL